MVNSATQVESQVYLAILKSLLPLLWTYNVLFLMNMYVCVYFVVIAFYKIKPLFSLEKIIFESVVFLWENKLTRISNRNT